MARIAQLIMQGSYWLGLLSLALGLAAKVFPAAATNLSVTARGGLILAGTLFLCSVASHFVGTTAAKQ